MIQPLGNLILIEPILGEKKYSLLSIKEEIPKSYKVLAIGDEVTKVDIGDEIIIEYPRTIEYNNAPHMFVNQDNIIAKVIS